MASHRVAGWAFGKELCDVMGLDGANTTRVELVAEPHRSAGLIVHQVVRDDQVAQLHELLSYYRLLPEDEFEAFEAWKASRRQVQRASVPV